MHDVLCARHSSVQLRQEADSLQWTRLSVDSHNIRHQSPLRTCVSISTFSRLYSHSRIHICPTVHALLTVPLYPCTFHTCLLCLLSLYSAKSHSHAVLRLSLLCWSTQPNLTQSRDELEVSDWSACDRVCLPDDATFAFTYFFIDICIPHRTPPAVIWIASRHIIYHVPRSNDPDQIVTHAWGQ